MLETTIELGVSRQTVLQRVKRGELEAVLVRQVVSRTRREARCCAKDEGRPFGAALWEEASNCRKLLRSKAAVVNVSVKRRGLDHVMCGIERRMQMNL